MLVCKKLLCQLACWRAHEQVVSKSYLVNRINMDWTKREQYFMNPVKSLPDTTIYHDLEVCEDDVWLVSNPKSGTTWMQELLWLLMNDCDYETALAKDLEVRSPFLEYVLFN